MDWVLGILEECLIEIIGCFAFLDLLFNCQGKTLKVFQGLAQVIHI